MGNKTVVRSASCRKQDSTSAKKTTASHNNNHKKQIQRLHIWNPNHEILISSKAEKSCSPTISNHPQSTTKVTKRGLKSIRSKKARNKSSVVSCPDFCFHQKSAPISPPPSLSTLGPYIFEVPGKGVWRVKGVVMPPPKIVPKTLKFYVSRNGEGYRLRLREACYAIGILD